MKRANCICYLCLREVFRIEHENEERAFAVSLYIAIGFIKVYAYPKLRHKPQRYLSSFPNCIFLWIFNQPDLFLVHVPRFYWDIKFWMFSQQAVSELHTQAANPMQRNLHPGRSQRRYGCGRQKQVVGQFNRW